MNVPEESTGTNSIPSPADDAGVGVDTESSTKGVDTAAVDFKSGDVVSVGAPVGLKSGDVVSVGAAVGFRSGDAVSAGAAVGWTVGAGVPHPTRTAVTLDTRTAMASRTTRFLISLHICEHKLYSV